MDKPVTYYTLSLLLLLSLVTNINPVPKRTMLETEKINITTYGVAVSLSVFVLLSFLDKCNQSSLLFLVFVFLIYIPVQSAICEECRREYKMVAFYQYGIPLLLLFYRCPSLITILTGFAALSAIGRIGCIGAGCCAGRVTSKNDQFRIHYSDPEQIINKKRNVKESYCTPSILVEGIMQMMIVGLMLQYRKYAGMIYGVGTALSVYLSNKYRNQEGRDVNNIGIINLLLFAAVCPGTNKMLCNKKPNYIRNGIIAGVIGLGASNDLNISNLDENIRKLVS